MVSALCPIYNSTWNISLEEGFGVVDILQSLWEYGCNKVVIEHTKLNAVKTHIYK